MRILFNVFATFVILGSVAVQAQGQNPNQQLRNGQKVWDASGQEGTVIGVFLNGDVSMKVSYFTQTVKRDSISVEGCITKQVCSGAKVYTRSGEAGTLLAISLGNRAQRLVKINYYNQFVSKEDLAIEGCHNGLCTDDKVATRQGQEGNLKGFFIDKSVLVKINYYYQVVPADAIAQSVFRGEPSQNSKWNRYKIGETVFTRDGQSGTLLGVFANGDLAVKISYYTQIYTSDNVALKGCFGLVCSGDSVALRNGQTGTVNGVFANGDVSVKTSYYNQVVSRDDVGVTR